MADIRNLPFVNGLLSVVYKKRLPQEFGGDRIYVTPRADRRVLYPGWEKCANDLVIVARQNIKKGDVVWDIGANLGIFSALASGKAGREGKVYAVEADPAYASIVQRTATTCITAEHASINALSAAVADKNGILTFNVAARGTARSSIMTSRDIKVERQISVVSVTLDTLLDDWAAPDFIKMDVEGAEALALQGAERLLSEARPTFYLEVSPENAETVGAIFEKHKYKMFKLNAGNELPVDLPGLYTIARPGN